jgi:hypothetical protein
MQPGALTPRRQRLTQAPQERPRSRSGRSVRAPGQRDPAARPRIVDPQRSQPGRGPWPWYHGDTQAPCREPGERVRCRRLAGDPRPETRLGTQSVQYPAHPRPARQADQTVVTQCGRWDGRTVRPDRFNNGCPNSLSSCRICALTVPGQ